MLIKVILKSFIPPVIWEVSRKVNLILKKKVRFDRIRKNESNETQIQISIGETASIKIVEDARITGLPRYKVTETIFFGHNLKIVDNASFQFIKRELFEFEIYKFESKKQQPYIIDCGANIGLSVIYFKHLFPNAEIVAFEPDEKVFKALQFNIGSFKLSDVTLIKKACWNEETTLKFYSEGADGGRVALNSDNDSIVEVQTIRLREFLKRKVDFLKIDIEGAESKVLVDCSDLLLNVEKIFVEYHSFIEMEQPLSAIFSTLQNAGFRLHVSAPGLSSRSPFIELKTYSNMDNQLNIYGSR